MKLNLKKDSMFGILFSLRGNQRACVYTEALWAVPFHLFSPFSTLYMYNLNVKDKEIGVILSFGLIIQVFSALAGGILSDKIGRRLTTLIGDVLSWSVPCLIWAFAQDFKWFIAGAFFNGLWHLSMNSWQSLLAEDVEPSFVIHLYNWIYVCGQFSVFFAPIAGVLIGRYSIVPVMRGLLIFAFFSMSLKFYLTFRYSAETRQGRVRVEETKNVPVTRIIFGYKDVFRQVIKDPGMVKVMLLITLSGVSMMATGNFFSLYVTQDLNINETWLSLFPLLRAFVMLIFFFGLQKALSKWSVKKALLIGLLLYVASHILLILIPSGSIVPLLIYLIVDACAIALFMPKRDALIITDVEPAERARITSIIYIVSLAATSPFGYLAGRLSGFDRRLPFVMNIALFIAMAGITAMGGKGRGFYAEN